MSKLTEFLDRPRILNQLWVFPYSTTIIPDIDIWALVGVVGGGGSGARVHGQPGYALAQGGNSGACALKNMYLNAGTSYTITVGAGGLSPSVVSAGNAGTLSRFQGGGVTITANGGAGGKGNQSATGASSTVSPTVAAAATATGGDFNFSGGQGGAYTYDPVSTGDSGIIIATGGGAVNLNGLPGSRVKGGDGQIINRSSAIAATGGAGVGGHGGNVTITTGAWETVTGGGGSLGDAENGDNEPYYMRVGLLGGPGSGTIASKFYSPTGQGGDGYNRFPNNPRMAGDGGGGGAFIATVPSEYWCAAGLFGGGGGCVPLTNTGDFEAGDGIIGGGGGGLATTYSGLNYRAGHGGNGLVFIDWVRA